MGDQSKRYRAFISYSQKDKRHAKRLHEALEAYRVPKGEGAVGVDPKSRKIGRFFRDEEEMGAATDLGAALRGAIADSESLIVVCSPHAAASKWVNAEVLHFKRTGRGDKIFAVIVNGEPNASRDPRRIGRECFPPALRYELGADGELTDRPAEPLGLDLRSDSFSRVRARLVAGLLNTQFDSLWRRQQRRRRQKLITTALGSTVVATIVAAASLYLLQRDYSNASETLARAAREATTLEQHDRAIRLGLLAVREAPLRSPSLEAEPALARAAFRSPLISELVADDKTITSAAISIDGSRVATGSEDGSLRIWDPYNATVVAELHAHTDAITSIEFQTNEIVLTASNDGLAAVWNTARNEQLSVFVHNAAIQYASFAAQGSLVLTCAGDNAARLWNVQSQSVVSGPLAQGGPMLACAVSHDGAEIAIGASERLLLWNAESDRSIPRVIPHDGNVFAVAFSPDGSRVITGTSNRDAYVFDARTGVRSATLSYHGAMIGHVGIDASGQFALTASQDGEAVLWDWEREQALVHYRGHVGPISSAEISADGGRVLTASEDGATRIWRTYQTHNQPRAIMSSRPGGVYAAHFSPDGRFIVAGGSYAVSAQVWDLENLGEPIYILDHSDALRAVRFSADGKWIVTGSMDQLAKLWRSDTGELVRTLSGHNGEVVDADFSPDSRLVATAGKDGLAIVWDVETGARIGETSFDGEMHAVRFSPSGEQLFVGGFEANDVGELNALVLVLDMGSWTVERVIDAGPGIVSALEIDAEGSLLAAATTAPQLLIWSQTASAETEPVVIELQSEAHSLSFSGDGGRLAIPELSGAVTVLDVISNTVVDRLTNVGAFVLAVEYGPNEEHLLIGEEALLLYRVGPWLTSRQTSAAIRDEVCGSLLAMESARINSEGRPDAGRSVGLRILTRTDAGDLASLTPRIGENVCG